MSTLADIVTTIATNIETALESADFEVTVEPGMLFNPPGTAIDIYPDEPFRDEDSAAMGSGGGYRFIVRARTGLNDLDSGQQILLALMDDENAFSIGLVLDDDPTLGGMAQDTFVDGPSGFRPFRDLGGEGTMAGVVWSVLVLAAHS